MSKISKNIKMLDILSSGRKYTCQELADRLEISPRMVRVYKEELEKEGIYIETTLGKDGGYRLISKVELPTILFNENDIEEIDYLLSKLKDKEDFEKLENIKQKICNYCRLVNDEEYSLDDDEISVLESIKDAIKRRSGVKIEYYSKGMTKERTVYPIQVYAYEDLVMIVVQYSDDVTDIRHLNLKRIKKIIK